MSNHCKLCISVDQMIQDCMKGFLFLQQYHINRKNQAKASGAFKDSWKNLIYNDEQSKTDLIWLEILRFCFRVAV